MKTRTLHRAARAKIPYPIVALVGYTNAGKSTLFNRLTGADVMAKGYALCHLGSDHAIGPFGKTGLM